MPSRAASTGDRLSCLTTASKRDVHRASPAGAGRSPSRRRELEVGRGRRMTRFMRVPKYAELAKAAVAPTSAEPSKASWSSPSLGPTSIVPITTAGLPPGRRSTNLGQEAARRGGHRRSDKPNGGVRESRCYWPQPRVKQTNGQLTGVSEDERLESIRIEDASRAQADDHQTQRARDVSTLAAHRSRKNEPKTEQTGDEMCDGDPANAERIRDPMSCMSSHAAARRETFRVLPHRRIWSPIRQLGN